MVACDGHRLAYAEAEGELAKPDKILIPRKALALAAGLFSSGTLYLAADENHVFMTGGAVRFVCRKLTGSFPDYERVLPRHDGPIAAIPRKPLLDAVSRALKQADERSHTVGLKLNGHCELSVTGPGNVPKFREIIPAEWTGPEDWPIMLNGRYLADMLSAHDCETVYLKLRGPERENQTAEESAADLYGDERTRTIIMPMRA